MVLILKEFDNGLDINFGNDINRYYFSFFLKFFNGCRFWVFIIFNVFLIDKEGLIKD